MKKQEENKTKKENRATHKNSSKAGRGVLLTVEPWPSAELCSY